MRVGRRGGRTQRQRVGGGGGGHGGGHRQGVGQQAGTQSFGEILGEGQRGLQPAGGDIERRATRQRTHRLISSRGSAQAQRTDAAVGTDAQMFHISDKCFLKPDAKKKQKKRN